MPRPIEIEPRQRFRIWIRYDDGAAGEVDLSALAGRGVFQAWNHPACFAAVRLGAYGEIMWGDEIELCPDAVYMQLTGKRPEEVFPPVLEIRSDA